MKYSFKRAIMAVTMLSAGFMVFPVSAAEFSILKPEPKYVKDKNLGQYKDVNGVLTESDMASSVHDYIRTLPAKLEEIQKHQAQIDRYNEIAKRLLDSENCNRKFLNTHFSEGDKIWDSLSAWAEESAKEKLAEASDETVDDAAELNKGAKYTKDGDLDQAKSDAKDMAGKYATGDFSDVNTKDETTGVADSLAQQKKEGNSVGAKMDAQNAAEGEQDKETETDKMRAFARIRWDIGTEVLKNLYAHPDDWGKPKKELMFKPWKDQMIAYNAYLIDRYAAPFAENEVVAKLKKKEIAKVLEKELPDILEKDFPDLFKKKFPKITEEPEQADAYLPEFSYTKPEVEPVKAEETEEEKKLKYNEADELFCGEGNECLRVNDGPFLALHQKILAVTGSSPSVEEAPYLPAAPLPPWKEVAYMLDDDLSKAVLPDPWIRIAQDSELLDEEGEFANLVVKNKTMPFFGKITCGSEEIQVCVDPKRYDGEKNEPKKKNGKPMIDLPLHDNRISAYLVLKASKEEAEPMKDNAIEAIKRIKQNLAADIQRLGYTIPNPDALDLMDKAQYKNLETELKNLQKSHLDAAARQIQAIRKTYPKLDPDVRKILDREAAIAKAMEKDSGFLLNVARGNYQTVDSDLKTAKADKAATDTYKKELEKTAEEEDLPTAYCPDPTL